MFDKIALVFAGFVALIGGLFASKKAQAEGAGVPQLTPSVTSGSPQSTDPTAPDFIPVSGSQGIRNNNPFNIRFVSSIQWRGQTGNRNGFVVFDTALNGIRAGMINIHTKMVRDGLTSVRSIINVLSPPVENPTNAFISFVAKRMGVSPDQPLVFSTHIVTMSKAIVQFENGSNPYPDSLFLQALAASGKG